MTFTEYNTVEQVVIDTVVLFYGAEVPA